ncbi:tigger transposable element-derived protein 6-like [Ornithodoros turicata]|uniref:tigger transposable element-derived protein 6-like n=1 Tax=Ornithodoros turicata TaxID=34597 RepID=UPI00313A2422
MEASRARKKRAGLTAGDKRDICQWKQAHPTANLNATLNWIRHDMGLDIAKSTLCTVLKDAGTWLGISSADASSMKWRLPELEALERSLVLWIEAMVGRKAVVSDKMVVEKARLLGALQGKLPTEDCLHLLFVLNGIFAIRLWLFLGIRSAFRLPVLKRLALAIQGSPQDFHGESGDVDPTTVSEGRERLHRVLQGYSLDDIYNFDETALFFKLGPTRTLSPTRFPGTKRSKVRVTVGLLCNASGTDKCKPVIIGHAQRPKDFGKKFSPAPYCYYYANGKAWMTSDIFLETLRRFDNTLKQENRQAILLVDNAGCHKLRGEEFTNLRVEFLPANTTSKIQPLDAGINRSAKVRYQTELVRHYIALAESGEKQTAGLRWCIRTFSRARGSVSPATIKNCWRHTGILPCATDEGECFSPDDDLPLAELRRQLRILDLSFPESAAEECISYGDSEDVSEPLDDNALVQLSKDTTDNEISDDDESSSASQPSVTAASAWKNIHSAILYFEEIEDQSSVNMLTSLLCKIDTAEGMVQSKITQYIA